MGYYTSYDIDFEGKKDRIEAFKKDLIAESDNDDCVKELLDMGYVDAKLYQLDEWITDVAMRHVDVLVCLKGAGEEIGDLWETRWKGDVVEHHSACIPPFKNYNLLTKNEKSKNNSVINPSK